MVTLTSSKKRVSKNGSQIFSSDPQVSSIVQNSEDSLLFHLQYFIKKLYYDGLLDKAETRLAICYLNKNVVENFSDFINNAINLEKLFLAKRIKKYDYSISG